MPKIRVLCADDSVVFRRLVAATLAKDPALEMCPAAANGKLALTIFRQEKPDLVILDVEMPELDGLQVLREIRKEHEKLPVIMFSSHTERGASATLDALALGATDYFAKPIGLGSQEAAMQVMRDELIPAIKALVVRRESAQPDLPAPHLCPREETHVEAVELVVIGASTGGPNALTAVLTQLPGDFPAPIVVAQHMPPLFTKLLAERLASKCQLSVREASQGDVLRPGSVWIAPGDYHLEVVREGQTLKLATHRGPHVHSCRPAVDVLFRSAAVAAGAGVLALVLTGMGEDGVGGSRAVRGAGGRVIVQDASSSVVWGMPGAVAQAGLANRVLHLHDLSQEMLRSVGYSAVGVVPAGGAPIPEATP